MTLISGKSRTGLFLKFNPYVPMKSFVQELWVNRRSSLTIQVRDSLCQLLYKNCSQDHDPKSNVSPQITPYLPRRQVRKWGRMLNIFNYKNPDINQGPAEKKVSKN